MWAEWYVSFLCLSGKCMWICIVTLSGCTLLSRSYPLKLPVCPEISSFSIQHLSKYALFFRFCSSLWGYRNEYSNPCPYRAYILICLQLRVRTVGFWQQSWAMHATEACVRQWKLPQVHYHWSREYQSEGRLQYPPLLQLLQTTNMDPVLAKVLIFQDEAEVRFLKIVIFKYWLNIFFKSLWKLNKTCLHTDSGLWPLLTPSLPLLVCLRGEMQWSDSCSHANSLLGKQWTNCQRFGISEALFAIQH